MTARDRQLLRSDVIAADRGGDPNQGMDGEADLRTSSAEEAIFWQRIYAEILALEEKVMARVHELMAGESLPVRREVELSNVPVIAAQVERFRQRHDFWTRRVAELATPPIKLKKADGSSASKS